MQFFARYSTPASSFSYCTILFIFYFANKFEIVIFNYLKIFFFWVIYPTGVLVLICTDSNFLASVNNLWSNIHMQFVRWWLVKYASGIKLFNLFLPQLWSKTYAENKVFVLIIISWSMSFFFRCFKLHKRTFFFQLVSLAELCEIVGRCDYQRNWSLNKVDCLSIGKSIPLGGTEISILEKKPLRA